MREHAFQAELIILKHREMLVAQRTQVINALRGHAAEFGVVAAKGTAQVQPLLDKLASDPAIPAAARAMFARIGEHVAELGRQIAAVDADLSAQHKASSVSQMLAEVPGIGPVTAITLAVGVDPAAFASGRHFAAWLGLTPKEHSTGGKQRLGRISKAGNERLRSLLVVGAMAVIRHAKPGKRSVSPWSLVRRVLCQGVSVRDDRGVPRRPRGGVCVLRRGAAVDPVRQPQDRSGQDLRRPLASVWRPTGFGMWW